LFKTEFLEEKGRKSIEKYGHREVFSKIFNKKNKVKKLKLIK